MGWPVGVLEVLGLIAPGMALAVGVKDSQNSGPVNCSTPEAFKTPGGGAGCFLPVIYCDGTQTFHTLTVRELHQSAASAKRTAPFLQLSPSLKTLEMVNRSSSHNAFLANPGTQKDVHPMVVRRSRCAFATPDVGVGIQSAGFRGIQGRVPCLSRSQHPRRPSVAEDRS